MNDYKVQIMREHTETGKKKHFKINMELREYYNFREAACHSGHLAVYCLVV